MCENCLQTDYCSMSEKRGINSPRENDRFITGPRLKSTRKMLTILVVQFGSCH